MNAVAWLGPLINKRVWGRGGNEDVGLSGACSLFLSPNRCVGALIWLTPFQASAAICPGDRVPSDLVS